MCYEYIMQNYPAIKKKEEKLLIYNKTDTTGTPVFNQFPKDKHAFPVLK